MKLFKNIVAILLVLMISVIVFFTFNLIFSLVSNYQSLSKVSLSGISMVMFMSEIIVLLFAIFNRYELKRNDMYFFRKYSLIEAGFALVGLFFAIFSGTYIYHTFIGDYVFNAYPLVMTTVHSLALIASGYIAFISIRTIVKEKPERKWTNYKMYWLRELLVGEMLVFALERLGAFVLIPVFWSDYDSVYVIPLFIQLLVPAFVFITYMVHEHLKKDRKLTMILSSIALGYSIFSLIYMILISHNRYPLTINPMSGIMQLERLITLPAGMIILYGFSIIVPALTILNMFVLERKDRKAKIAE